MTMSRWQVAGGVTCLILGPLAQLIQYLVSPVGEGAKAAGQIAAATAHPAAMRASLVLDVAILLVVPGVLYAGHLAGGARSRLAAAGTALVFVTSLAAGYLLAQDVVISAAAAQPDHQSAAGLAAAFESSGVVTGIVVAYLAGHTVGFILLGIALARSRAVPAWAGIALAAWPFAEMGGEAAGAKPVAAAGFALLLAGFGACALALARRREPAPASGHLVTAGHART
jgi:hypothetical protein